MDLVSLQDDVASANIEVEFETETRRREILLWNATNGAFLRRFSDLCRFLDLDLSFLLAAPLLRRWVVAAPDLQVEVGAQNITYAVSGIVSLRQKKAGLFHCTYSWTNEHGLVSINETGDKSFAWKLYPLPPTGASWEEIRNERS